jgi:hypothetical protein
MHILLGDPSVGLLNKILRVSGVLSARDYIGDLTTGSTSAHLINEDFKKYASDLPIFSFYETLRMKLGITSSIIVEKYSALLGMNAPISFLKCSRRILAQLI